MAIFRSQKGSKPRPNSSPECRTKRNYDDSNSRNRKRNSVEFRLTEDDNPVKKDIAMAQVRILKRGETLGMNKNNKNFANPDAVFGSTVRSGLGPKTDEPLGVNKENDAKRGCGRDGEDLLYAGSGFQLSPPPSLVPFPGFLAKIFK